MTSKTKAMTPTEFVKDLLDITGDVNIFDVSKEILKDDFTSDNTPFRDGDVIVQADGQAGFIRESRVFKDLFAVFEYNGSLRLNTVELNHLQYPVTIVVREGDPTVNIVVKRKKSGKFKAKGE